jgi:hypothetical protein
MAGTGRKLASFLWWTYPRGSLEYDIMVGIILAFIFFTPRHFFRDTPRPLPAADAAFARLHLPARPAPPPVPLAVAER